MRVICKGRSVQSPHYFVAVLVTADAGETWMTQPIFWRPFEKLDTCYQKRVEPAASGHLCGREPFAPLELVSLAALDENAPPQSDHPGAE
jgi:hypothetical protein